MQGSHRSEPAGSAD